LELSLAEADVSDADVLDSSGLELASFCPQAVRLVKSDAPKNNASAFFAVFFIIILLSSQKNPFAFAIKYFYGAGKPAAFENL